MSDKTISSLVKRCVYIASYLKEILQHQGQKEEDVELLIKEIDDFLVRMESLDCNERFRRMRLIENQFREVAFKTMRTAI